MNRESGPLRNGNPRKDLSTVARCGARTRRGTACLAPAMKNGRCRSHGGKSTGATSREGRAAQIAANTVHGYYGEEGRTLRGRMRLLTSLGRILREKG
jgi:hypothetical protein